MSRSHAFWGTDPSGLGCPCEGCNEEEEYDEEFEAELKSVAYGVLGQGD